MSAPERASLTTDPELVSAAQDGDEDAFVQLHERHAPLAWRTALAITGVADEAAHTVSESFARTFTAIRAGRHAPDSTFRSLLLTSVRHTALDNRRRDADQPDTPTPFAYAEGSEDSIVGAAFAPLPERWRSVLWLSHVESLPMLQIAPIVGLREPATVALATRARHGLTEQYLHLQLSAVADPACDAAAAELGAFLSQTLSPAETAELEEHLLQCPSCAGLHDELTDATRRLRMLALPVPTELLDDTRAKWAAVVTTPARRTGTGLSATAEKVLAGVSAVAAAFGILGATMFGASNSPSDERAASSPAAVTESVDVSDSDPVSSPIELPAPPALDASIAGSTGTTGTTVRGRSGRTGNEIVGTSRSGSRSTTTRDLGGTSVTEPRRDGTTTTTSTSTTTTTQPKRDGGSGDTGTQDADAAPAVKVGTTVGDVPVAVEVGEDPGATVGPVSVGSQPEPDEEPVAVDGPLAPIAPIVDSVVAPIGEAIDQLTAGLGL